MTSVNFSGSLPAVASWSFSSTAGVTATSPSSSLASSGGGTVVLSSAAQSKIDQLKGIDRKVRAHEQAHVAAGGELILSGVSFSYQKGPDGKLYAVGGDVSIDTSPGRVPEETVTRADRIRAAALAPADPSAQDRQVAADASSMKANAQREIAAEQHAKESIDQSGGGGRQQPVSTAAEHMVALYEAVSRSGDYSTGLNEVA